LAEAAAHPKQWSQQSIESRPIMSVIAAELGNVARLLALMLYLLQPPV
jgi:hypothetical protein